MIVSKELFILCEENVIPFLRQKIRAMRREVGRVFCTRCVVKLEIVFGEEHGPPSLASI